MRIGPHQFANQVALAPMAGISDRPFRTLCKTLGAGWTVSEMVGANPRLRHTQKSRQRTQLGDGSSQARIVQIVGADPHQLAEAARYNVDLGAHIIDINMGCPAKKVCSVAAGSALLRDELLVGRILEAVVAAVPVPVTLKTRTGWDQHARNGVRIARIAEAAGIQAIAMHGRTRADRYDGSAEYDTIAEACSRVRIPVIANGDIDTPHKAADILRHTGAAAVMIGRAARGRPWLPGQIAHFLASGELLPAPQLAERESLLSGLVRALHGFYGATLGVRIARKHIGWQIRDLCAGNAPPGWLRSINQAVTAKDQLDRIGQMFEQLAEPARAPVAAPWSGPPLATMPPGNTSALVASRRPGERG
jgi:tRNA-dihydrouridine synthase B